MRERSNKTSERMLVWIFVRNDSMNRQLRRRFAAHACSLSALRIPVEEHDARPARRLGRGWWTDSASPGRAPASTQSTWPPSVRTVTGRGSHIAAIWLSAPGVTTAEEVAGEPFRQKHTIVCFEEPSDHCLSLAHEPAGQRYGSDAGSHSNRTNTAASDVSLPGRDRHGRRPSVAPGPLRRRTAVGMLAG